MMTVVVDTREQRPFSFDPARVTTIRGTLPVGDYSIAGHELEVVVERKSLQDYVGSITQGRARFFRELERLALYDYAAIVVEGSLEDLVVGNYRSAASPASIAGTQPILLYSQDGGTSWAQQTITTLFSNEDVAEGCTIGDDLVYISNIANSIHWTEIDMIFDGTNIWNEVTNGFVKNKGPRSIWNIDPRHTWIVGDGGYIYYCSNHQTGVQVVDAGVTTTQNLLSVNAYDVNNVIAVGNSNAIVWSKNGGDTWASVIGPAVGVNLGACWMWDKDTWFVGEGAGGTGKLWVTNDQGHTWTQVALPITVNRIDKILFVSEAEGYVSARSGGMSYILRTFIAGNEWLVLPQGKRSLPLNNSSLTDLAVCSKYSNTMFAAGLASNGTAGIIVRCGA